MKSEQPHFNLVDEQWIKATALDGGTVEVSLRELFHKAHILRSLANDIATQDFAILRVLLAILQRSIANRLDNYDYPSEAWGDLWDFHRMPTDEIDGYLDKWRHRFDLFDPTEPFMQVADMQATNGKASDIKKIIADVPDGDPLFSQRSVMRLKSIGYAEAARWLIHAHAYDTGGIKTGVLNDPSVKNGKSYQVHGYVGTGWAGALGGIFLEGNNLFETLMLNLCLCKDCRDDCDSFLDTVGDLPTWEQVQKNPGDDHRFPHGYADMYTWQSRRVLLKESCGEVERVLLTNGDRLTAHNKRSCEPMTPWRRNVSYEKKLNITPVFLPLQHQLGKAMWQGLNSLLPSRETQEDDQIIVPGNVSWIHFLASKNGGQKLKRNYVIRIHAVGAFYDKTHSESLIVEVLDDSLFIKSSLFTDEGADAIELAKHCIAQTDCAVDQLQMLAEKLNKASGNRSKQLTKMLEAVKTEAYYSIDTAFRNWLLHIKTDDLSGQESLWNTQAKKIIAGIGKRLVEESNPVAMLGRKTELGVRKKRWEWVSAGKAEMQFIRDLAKALPDITDEPKEGEVE